MTVRGRGFGELLGSAAVEPGFSDLDHFDRAGLTSDHTTNNRSRA